MISYPAIDPVIFSVGPFAAHWYGLMYVIGFAVAWWLARRRAARPDSSWIPVDVDDLIFYAAIGLILGGRLGWVAFYGVEQVQDDWTTAFRLWEGGMSFHGGLIGVILAVLIFARRRERRLSDVLDFVAPLPGIGILMGRIANFINGELWGKQTDSAWAFIVDMDRLHPAQAVNADRLCRHFDVYPCVLHVHASQLYEGILEGLLLFIVLWLFTRRPRPTLAPAGLFLIFYGVSRVALEFVRVPDPELGYLLFDWVTMGQLLTAPMIVGGLVLLIWAYVKRTPSGNYGPKPVAGPTHVAAATAAASGS